MHSCEPVVKDVSFSLLEGERLAITGESGSGKSMILSAITSSLPDNCYASGEIYVNGVEIVSNPKIGEKMLSSEIAYVPQGGAESLNPSLRIKTQMMEVLRKEEKKLSKSEKNDLCVSALKKVGLDKANEILLKYPFEISGGEAQRVVLAIALLMNKRLLVVDEATRGIDKEKSGIIWDCLDCDFPSVSTLLVTHDLSEARKCDKILVLKDGEVEEFGKKEDIFDKSENPYVKKLIADYGGEYA